MSEELIAERDALLSAAEEDRYVIETMGRLLARIAIALKGEQLPNQLHSYHDLPEMVEMLVKERDALRQSQHLGDHELADRLGGEEG